MVKNPVVDTHKIQCRGVEKKDVGSTLNVPSLKREDAETVIVKVYRSGRAIPLCRHFADGYCRAPYTKASGSSLDHDRRVVQCVYMSEPIL